MTNPKIIRKVGLALFKEKKIIMVRERGEKVFYMVGGTVEGGESDIECLHRELMEELGTSLDKESVLFLNEFKALAHGRQNTLVKIKLYAAKLRGDLRPGNEIEEIQYFDSSVNPELLSEISTTKIYPWLKEHDLIG